MNIKDLNPDSKLWLYASDRALSPTEQVWIGEQLEAFTQTWAAHGKGLCAAGAVLSPYFIALAVDTQHENASGCSIDGSVRFIKELGKELNVDFFNRTKMWVERTPGVVEWLPFSTLKNELQAHVYNPMLTRLGDLENHFFVAV